jgi:hypothetical protein
VSFGTLGAGLLRDKDRQIRALHSQVEQAQQVIIHQQAVIERVIALLDNAALREYRIHPDALHEALRGSHVG